MSSPAEENTSGALLQALNLKVTSISFPFFFPFLFYFIYSRELRLSFSLLLFVSTVCLFVDCLGFLENYFSNFSYGSGFYFATICCKHIFLSIQSLFAHAWITSYMARMPARVMLYTVIFILFLAAIAISGYELAAFYGHEQNKPTYVYQRTVLKFMILNTFSLIFQILIPAFFDPKDFVMTSAESKTMDLMVRRSMVFSRGRDLEQLDENYNGAPNEPMPLPSLSMLKRDIGVADFTKVLSSTDTQFSQSIETARSRVDRSTTRTTSLTLSDPVPVPGAAVSTTTSTAASTKNLSSSSRLSRDLDAHKFNIAMTVSHDITKERKKAALARFMKCVNNRYASFWENDQCRKLFRNYIFFNIVLILYNSCEFMVMINSETKFLIFLGFCNAAVHIISLVNLSRMPCERMPDSPLAFPQSSAIMAKYVNYVQQNAYQMILWRTVALYSMLSSSNTRGGDKVVLNAIRDVVMGVSAEPHPTGQDALSEDDGVKNNILLSRPQVRGRSALASAASQEFEEMSEELSQRNPKAHTRSKHALSSSVAPNPAPRRAVLTHSFPDRDYQHAPHGLYNINEGERWTDSSTESSDGRGGPMQLVKMREQDYAETPKIFKFWNRYWVKRIDELLNKNLEDEQQISKAPSEVLDDARADAYRILMSYSYFRFMALVRFSRFKNPNIICNSELGKSNFIQSTLQFLRTNSWKDVLLEPLSLFFPIWTIFLKTSNRRVQNLQTSQFFKTGCYLIQNLSFSDTLNRQLVAILSQREIQVTRVNMRKVANFDELYVLDYARFQKSVSPIVRFKLNEVYQRIVGTDVQNEAAADQQAEKETTSLTKGLLDQASAAATHRGGAIMPQQVQPFRSSQLSQLKNAHRVDSPTPQTSPRAGDSQESERSSSIPKSTSSDAAQRDGPTPAEPREGHELPPLPPNLSTVIKQRICKHKICKKRHLSLEIDEKPPLATAAAAAAATPGSSPLKNSTSSLVTKKRNEPKTPTEKSLAVTKLRGLPAAGLSFESASTTERGWFSPKNTKNELQQTILRNSTFSDDYMPYSGPTILTAVPVSHLSKDEMSTLCMRLGYNIFSENVSVDEDLGGSAYKGGPGGASAGPRFEDRIDSKDFSQKDSTEVNSDFIVSEEYRGPVGGKRAAGPESEGPGPERPPSSMGPTVSSSEALAEDPRHHAHKRKGSLTIVPQAIKEAAEMCETQAYCGEKLYRWDFDAFHLKRISRGHPLLSVALEINSTMPHIFPSVLTPFHTHNFVRFVLLIESLYKQNPYHSSTHAADVLQFVNAMVCKIRAEHMLPRKHSNHTAGHSETGTPLSRVSAHKFSDASDRLKPKTRRLPRKNPASLSDHLPPSSPTRRVSETETYEVNNSDNPYTSDIAATYSFQDPLGNDVFSRERRVSWISDVHHAILLVAAIIHDVDHLGYNNLFLSSISHPLANMYGKQSTLEAHSASLGFCILEYCGFELAADVREFLRLVVLSTDNGFHGDIIFATKKLSERFDEDRRLRRNAISILKTIKPQEFVDTIKHPSVGSMFDTKKLVIRARTLLLQLIIKQADVNNPQRPKRLAYPWAESVMEEFYRHGDHFKRMGFPIDVFSERDNKSEQLLAKCQVGFISYMVFPLQNHLEHLVTLLFGFEKNFLSKDWSMSKNLKFWKALAEGRSLVASTPVSSPTSTERE
eukprot:gnl/Chilomastix_cuspidata/1621.p1 GENE.gnl/Chilomastix_cuspidata/1621~~gnl/Chilomastix_cuspidata/1621.p1  ORF type:complete len:1671 (-),score=418.07 gnl/Chilomastix_cuspidata/1621:246-5258(-)